MLVRVAETYHVVFYAPFYVAYRSQFFEREGLEIGVLPGGSNAVTSALMGRGEADIGIGGIMRSLVAFDRGEATVPVHFARINDRDGFLLLGHTPEFNWPDLAGRRLIVFAEAPTPWTVLRAHLIEMGFDANAVHVIDDVPLGEVAAAFREGRADFALTQAHIAEELLRDGQAFLLRDMAAEHGPLPYSSYYCGPDYLSSGAEELQRFNRAHVRALRWIRQHEAEEVWDLIAPSFSGEDSALLAAAVARYHALEVWHNDATLPRSSFQRLGDRLVRGGLIRRLPPYELVCNDLLAREAEARLAAS